MYGKHALGQIGQRKRDIAIAPVSVSARASISTTNPANSPIRLKFVNAMECQQRKERILGKFTNVKFNPRYRYYRVYKESEREKES